MNKGAVGSTWEAVQNELFTPEVEEISGVSQPVIARMERGQTSPQLDTVLKLLASLGKTLAVVPINTKSR